MSDNINPNRNPRPGVKIPKAIKSKAWVGVWKDGHVGWHGVNHISHYANDTASIPPRLLANPMAKGQRVYLCDVTITPRTDKLGRPITRIIHNASSEAGNE
jgi:hypothetical protein